MPNLEDGPRDGCAVVVDVVVGEVDFGVGAGEVGDGAAEPVTVLLAVL